MNDTAPPAPMPSDTAPVSSEGMGGERVDAGLPRRFGKYTLLSRLAAGGMAELFLALQTSVAGFEKLVVIKQILPKMNRDPSFVDMLLQEARVTAALSHPNVVQIFDAGQIEGSYFIAMEFVHGEDVRSIVRQMRRAPNPAEFPREHAVGIVLGVCAGLAYAHEKRDIDGTPLRIVHRDVSPQNVLVTYSGDVKIIDFGIAKGDVRNSTWSSVPSTSRRDAATPSSRAKLQGKVTYMSPEQARGGELDARSDVFSTGVMLFELTTGQRLFKTPSEYETLKRICDGDYPRPSQIDSGYPPALEAIVTRALAKDPNERFQSAREMQAALEDFVRREQWVVSPLALRSFMHGLFAEKLAAHADALLRGKKLAAAIPPAPVHPVEAPVSEEFSSVASRASGVPARASRMPWLFAVAATLALALSLFGSRFSRASRGVEVPPAGQILAVIPPVPPKPAPVPEAPVAAISPPAAQERVRAEPLVSPSLKPRTDTAPSKRAPAGATGKLNVAAAGGWCDVAIDGKGYGPTPVASIELTAGSHKVTCTPSGGAAQSATVHVPAAGTERYRFQL